MGYYLAIKKKKILPFAIAWVDLENIMLSKISQSEKNKYHMISLFVESNKQTELTREMGTDSQIESRMTASVEGIEGVERLSKRGKRTHRRGQQCGDCWGDGGIRGLNGNGQNTIKIKSN